jgi:serine/threonine-protein kinase ULK2
MIENYSYGLSDEIGKGFSSKVFKGKNETTQETVAVKVIDMQMLKSPVHLQLLQSEIEALNLINHPNVMKLYKVFQTTNNTYLITEFCEGGDLASRKGKQSE